MRPYGDASITIVDLDAIPTQEGKTVACQSEKLMTLSPADLGYTTGESELAILKKFYRSCLLWYTM